MLIAFEMEGIFIVSNLFRHRASVFAFLVRQVNIQMTYSNTDPKRTYRQKQNKKIKQKLKSKPKKSNCLCYIMLICTLQLIKMYIICIGVFTDSNKMSSWVLLFGLMGLIFFRGWGLFNIQKLAQDQ